MSVEELCYIGWSETVRGMLDLGLYSIEPLEQDCRTPSELIQNLTGIENVPARKAAAEHLNLDNSLAALIRLQWLGLFDDDAIPTWCKSPRGVVSDLFLKKLVHEPQEKDLVVMQRRYEILYPSRGSNALRVSTLVDRHRSPPGYWDPSSAFKGR